MSLDTDLQAKLQTLAGAAPVQQNFASTDLGEPRVWYQRSSGETDLFLSDTPGMTETVYSLEVGGLDPDATGTLSDSLKSSLNGFRGTMGGSNVLGVFVQEQSDDYQPRGLNTDDGYHIFAFQVRVLT